MSFVCDTPSLQNEPRHVIAFEEFHLSNSMQECSTLIASCGEERSVFCTAKVSSLFCLENEADISWRECVFILHGVHSSTTQSGWKAGLCNRGRALQSQKLIALLRSRTESGLTVKVGSPYRLRRVSSAWNVVYVLKSTYNIHTMRGAQQCSEYSFHIIISLS